MAPAWHFQFIERVETQGKPKNPLVHGHKIFLRAASPDRVQQACRKILVTLATHATSWEVRYGGLLAMQFLVVVEKNNLEFTTTATNALKDQCDDVVGVAAQVLLVATQMGASFPSCIEPWEKHSCAWIRRSRRVRCSRASLPLELQRGQQLPVNTSEIWNQMLRFLDFPSSAIQISTLSALPSLLEKAATSQKVSLPSQETYSALVFRVFDSFSEPNLYVNDCPTMSRMSVARESAWKAIAALAPTILVSERKYLWESCSG
ncbi:hypothetical protein MHU86_16587 [Fragilaria crotonensis]|nr:hypothetical protein MHU86_16587 [Fragilaria crotonensis]